ncbi:DUF983 domain-containing protein [Sphingomonas sp.]|uniref:DUF983 domain-containing protein n=1 Tax=Sphingomonas sp. TaxID=28214 RepID=UPI0025F57B1F|nr:DUF983 domain-containing protein [Sphingomonas sp.]
MTDAPTLTQCAIGGLCPRCGAKTLFAGVIRFADNCSNCGLDYSSFNVGDGPAAILTMVIGGIIVLLAAVVELNWSPGLLVHAILWIPLATFLVVFSQRLAKAALLAIEYRRAAAEGRIKDRP